MTTYYTIQETKIPSGLRWDTPPENGGQIVVTSYADPRPIADEACRGAPYRRVTDRSDQSVTYSATVEIAARAANLDTIETLLGELREHGTEEDLQAAEDVIRGWTGGALYTYRDLVLRYLQAIQASGETPEFSWAGVW